MLEAPGQAHANLLKDLYCLDAVLTISLEWRPWTTQAARRRIRGAQRHYFARRYSMMAHAQETQGTAAAMVDSAAAAESDRLGGALVELEADGVADGEASLTVALHGGLDEIERLGRRLQSDSLAETRSVHRQSSPSRWGASTQRWGGGGRRPKSPAPQRPSALRTQRWPMLPSPIMDLSPTSPKVRTLRRPGRRRLLNSRSL